MKNIFELEDDIAGLLKQIDVLKEDKKQLEKICYVREAERNEARQTAWLYRSMYLEVSGEFADEYQLPWEGEE